MNWWTMTGLLAIKVLFVTNATALTSYPIEVSYDDELFIINGEKYEAQTYCFNMKEGDRIVFLEGSAFGACVSEKLLNVRTKQICRVWCE